MIENTLKVITRQLGELPQIIRSVIVVGSYSNSSANLHSDVDLLILTHSKLTAKKSLLIGEKLNESINIKENGTSFHFFNPVCERCKLLNSVPHKFHIIVHPWPNIKKWLKEKDFMVCMWANKFQVLWGENPFKEKIFPEVNESLLDDLDGIPSFVREINNVLISKSQKSDSHEYERYNRFYMHRILELIKFFPEIAKKASIPSNTKGANGLIEISKYFLAMQKEIEYYLDQVLNKKNKKK